MDVQSPYCGSRVGLETERDRCLYLPHYSLLFLFSWLIHRGGATAFFELALIIEFAAMLFVGVPITQPSSKFRALFEWVVIGLVWIMIVLVALTILSLH
jgi:hypothetical protein